MPKRIHDKDNQYSKLVELMKVLREECPWDREQTLSSLRRYTLEEAHEVLEAVEIAEQTKNWHPLRNELGDLLLQVAFYARIAEESEAFDLGDVIDTLIEKMIYRHPHVFDNKRVNDLELSNQWNELKDAEHADRTSLMDGIPPLPALKFAQKVQQRAARANFDWSDAADVLEKMHEELGEFEQEVRTTPASHERMEDEFGDILFTLVNLGRKLGIDAELALMRTNRKFSQRFRSMEKLAEPLGGLVNMPLDEQEELYGEAKRALRESETRQ